MTPNRPVRFARTALAAFAALSIAAAAAPAFADLAQSRQVVDTAKAGGQVGEQGDGYLGFVNGNADPAVQAAVAEINAGRAQAYREAAAKTGVSPEAAAQAAARQLIARAPAGQYVKPLGGGWTRK